MTENQKQGTIETVRTAKLLLPKALLLCLFVVLLVTIPVIARSSAEYEIPWDTLSSGGDVMASTHYQMQSTIGQSIIGRATSSHYALGSGYWYGVREPGSTLFLPLLNKG